MSTYSSMANATFRHSSTLPYDIKLSSDVDYKKQVKGSDVTQDVLAYKVKADRTYGVFGDRACAGAGIRGGPKRYRGETASVEGTEKAA